MKDLIISGNNETFGVDPREVGRDSLRAAGHEKLPLLRVIREKCMDCCAQQQVEVRKCTAVDCPLWPYRMGKNPFSERKGNIAALRGKQ